MTFILPRRKFITGLAALFVAPAIVKAESLMPIKPVMTTDDLMRRYSEFMDLEAKRLADEITFNLKHAIWSVPDYYTGYLQLGGLAELS